MNEDSRNETGGVEESDGHSEDAKSAGQRKLDQDSHDASRRRFLRRGGLAAMSAAVGASIPFGKYMPSGLIPVVLADTETSVERALETGLTVLNDRPVNIETPAHMLDDDVTPSDRLFVRNNGIPPHIADIDPHDWTIELAGESCVESKILTLPELKARFDHHTLQLQLECGGNGRSEFYPPASGNQWTKGAIGCPEWTGVRLRDVLKYCGIREDSVYVAYEGADSHLSGDPSKQAISRGVPITKALENESMLVWAMNGEPLPLLHGYPLRMLCSGWPASVSGKWVTRILIRDRVHDGAKMLGKSYRVPCKPVAPGAEVPDEDMCIIHSMPVKSLVTYPASGITYTPGKTLRVRGHAWAGDLNVQRMYTSIDFGATWQEARLANPVNRLAWQHWSQSVDFPGPGYYEVWARAVDSEGNSQPMVLPGWNPRGYLNNACHRIAVRVA